MPCVVFASPPVDVSGVWGCLSVAGATCVEATEQSPKETDITEKGDLLVFVSDRAPE